MFGGERTKCVGPSTAASDPNSTRSAPTSSSSRRTSSDRHQEVSRYRLGSCCAWRAARRRPSGGPEKRVVEQERHLREPFGEPADEVGIGRAGCGVHRDRNACLGRRLQEGVEPGRIRRVLVVGRMQLQPDGAGGQPGADVVDLRAASGSPTPAWSATGCPRWPARRRRCPATRRARASSRRRRGRSAGCRGPSSRGRGCGRARARRPGPAPSTAGSWRRRCCPTRRRPSPRRSRARRAPRCPAPPRSSCRRPPAPGRRRRTVAGSRRSPGGGAAGARTPPGSRGSGPARPACAPPPARPTPAAGRRSASSQCQRPPAPAVVVPDLRVLLGSRAPGADQVEDVASGRSPVAPTPGRGRRAAAAGPARTRG